MVNIFNLFYNINFISSKMFYPKIKIYKGFINSYKIFVIFKKFLELNIYIYIYTKYFHY